MGENTSILTSEKPLVEEIGANTIKICCLDFFETNYHVALAICGAKTALVLVLAVRLSMALRGAARIRAGTGRAAIAPTTTIR